MGRGEAGGGPRPQRCECARAVLRRVVAGVAERGVRTGVARGCDTREGRSECAEVTGMAHKVFVDPKLKARRWESAAKRGNRGQRGHEREVSTTSKADKQDVGREREKKGTSLLTAPGVVIHEQHPIEHFCERGHVPERVPVWTRERHRLCRGGDLRIWR